MNPTTQSFLTALQRLSKSGYQTSEFGLVAVLIATLALAGYSGHMSPDLAAGLATALGIAYKYFRAQVKGQVGNQILALADKLDANPSAVLLAPAAAAEQVASVVLTGAEGNQTIAPQAASVPPLGIGKPLTAISLLAVLAFSGCSAILTAKIDATAAYAERKTLSVLEGAVFSDASSLLDRAESGKAVDFTQGLTVGLRSAEGNLLSADDVRSLVAIWTKKAPDLAPLANKISTSYAAVNPKTPKQAAAALETIAKGLDAATGATAAKP